MVNMLLYELFCETGFELLFKKKKFFFFKNYF